MRAARIPRVHSFSPTNTISDANTGLADPHADELAVRGELAAREFLAFWLREGRDGGDERHFLLRRAAPQAIVVAQGPPSEL